MIIMHVLQRTFCVILISFSVLKRVSPLLLKQPIDATVDEEFRHPTFTKNILCGLDRAQAISGSSSTMRLVEVRNTAPIGSRGSTSLNDFRRIDLDLIITDGPLVPYGSRRATFYGSVRSWGSWSTSLVNFRDVDPTTASRAFEWDQIIMDEDEAHTILFTKGFMGPWACIYLCKLPATGLLFYVFKEPKDMGSSQNTFQVVGVRDGSVRLVHDVFDYPCSHLLLDLTTNITFQAEPANRTDLQASPSGSTNLTSRKGFRIEGVLLDNTAAF